MNISISQTEKKINFQDFDFDFREDSSTYYIYNLHICGVAELTQIRKSNFSLYINLCVNNLSQFPFGLFGTHVRFFYSNIFVQGVFFNWYPPKKLKYGKPRLGESTLT